MMEVEKEMQDCEKKKKNKINDFVKMPSYWSAAC